MVREDTIQFESNIPTKNNAKNRSLFSRRRGINPSYIGKNFTYKNYKETTYESTEFVSLIFIVKGAETT